MTATQFNKLDKVMAKGKWHYIILHGVIGWGISTAVLFSLLQSFTGEAAFIDVIGLSLILFPLGGVGWGVFMWSHFNKQINKFKDSEL